MLSEVRSFTEEEFLRKFRPCSAPKVLEHLTTQWQPSRQQPRTQRDLRNRNILHEVHPLHSTTTKSDPIPTSFQHTHSVNTSNKCNLSKRPMGCPISDCTKLITLSSVILHFSFDHPKIVQHCIQLGESQIIQLSLQDLDYGKNVCLALLLLVNNDHNQEYVCFCIYIIVFKFIN